MKKILIYSKIKHLKIIFLTAFIVLLTACTDKKFDSEQWKSWTEKNGEFALRWDMCVDLIDNYLSIGMSKEDVVDLIGMPYTDCDYPKCDIRYGMGPCRSGINYGTLYLTFVDNKLVKIYKYCG